jgi:hypothetical protein
MTVRSETSAIELYRKVVEAVSGNPAIETELLADFEGTLVQRFGVAVPKPGRLVRNGSGYLLSYDGKDYDLGDPRHAAKGELNDMELELVSAGGDECPQSGDAGSRYNPQKVERI